MLKKILIILVVLLMITATGLSGYLWQETRSLNQHILAQDREIETGRRRQRAIQKKYTQEKAKLGTCLRAKMAEQGKNRALQNQVTSLTGENEALAAEIAKAESRLKSTIAAHKARIEKLDAAREKVAASLEALREKYKAVVLSGREKDEQISVLDSEKRDLESQLKMLENRLSRNRKHNEKLSVIAEELTQKYREKSSGGDPFTKLKMVEIEHMIQEYIKRIDKEKILTR